MTFPIDRSNQRALPEDYDGEVFVCDIDRTYLMTRFSSLKGLARIPFEFAVDKQSIAGMTALLKEVRRGPGPGSRQTPLYFVSASPAQLRSVIERKLTMDGLEYDGTTFKDWLGVMRSGRVRRFREQVGFKLTALLKGRVELPRRAHEVLIGDDLESDAEAFCVYADLVAGRLQAEEALAVLARLGVGGDDARAIVALRQRVEPVEGVSRVLIRLERHEHAEDFLDFAPHVVACRSPLQMAMVLLDAGSIGMRGLARVAQELLDRGRSARQLGEELGDAVRRALTSRERAESLLEELAREGTRLEVEQWPSVDFSWRLVRPREAGVPWTPQALLG